MILRSTSQFGCVYVGEVCSSVPSPLPPLLHAFQLSQRLLPEEQETRTSLVLLDGMRTVVDRLLMQSQELGRIEAANQERRAAMRTNKVREALFS